MRRQAAPQSPAGPASGWGADFTRLPSRGTPTARNRSGLISPTTYSRLYSASRTRWTARRIGSVHRAHNPGTGHCIQSGSAAPGRFPNTSAFSIRPRAHPITLFAFSTSRCHRLEFVLHLTASSPGPTLAARGAHGFSAVVSEYEQADCHMSCQRFLFIITPASQRRAVA